MDLHLDCPTCTYIGQQRAGPNPSNSLTQNTPNNVLEASGFFLNLSVTSQLEKRFVDAKSLYEIDLV